MAMNEFVDKKVKIGLFDSGIGGFSVMLKLFQLLPDAEYFYFSDDANAPYGPKSDEFITERSFYITHELLKKEVDIVVVACNTATAASIDKLREHFKTVPFVGVEPYLNAFYKLPEGPKKLAVLTTESTGKSERFKRLKERLDPEHKIQQITLKNLARLIEDFYFKRIDKNNFLNAVKAELVPVADKNFTHVILGCTHYPLISSIIEQEINSQTISPCQFVGLRVCDLLNINPKNETQIKNKKFNFCSSKNNQWIELNQKDCDLPF